jgi:hypothetical protein
MTRPEPLLLDEPVITFYPALAVRLKGVNAAVMMQQLHFLINLARANQNRYVFIDGMWWVYNSYPQWLEYFPWLSEATIKRTFLELEKLGFVVSRQGVKDSRDRRKWYTIDYPKWRAFVTDSSDASGQIDPMTSGQIDPMISETPSETPSLSSSENEEDRIEPLRGSEPPFEIPFHSSMKQTVNPSSGMPIPFDPPSRSGPDPNSLPDRPPSRSNRSPLADADEHNLMRLCVGRTWNTDPDGGYADVIMTQILGTATKKGERREWKLEAPMKPVEVLAFGLWLRNEQKLAGLDQKMVEKAQTIYEKAAQFRGASNYDTAMKMAAKELRKLTGEPEEDAPHEELRDASAEIDAAIGGLTDLVRSQQNRRPHE